MGMEAFSLPARNHPAALKQRFRRFTSSIKNGIMDE